MSLNRRTSEKNDFFNLILVYSRKHFKFISKMEGSQNHGHHSSFNSIKSQRYLGMEERLCLGVLRRKGSDKGASRATSRSVLRDLQLKTIPKCWISILPNNRGSRHYLVPKNAHFLRLNLFRNMFWNFHHDFLVMNRLNEYSHCEWVSDKIVAASNHTKIAIFVIPESQSRIFRYLIASERARQTIQAC